jgi:UDP-glucose 4-epimerase
VLTLSGAKVAVTGGAGFIGSHLVDQLLGTGNEVTVIDDLSTGSRDNLAGHASNPRLRLAVASVLDREALEKALDGVQYVFHLATRNVRLSLRQPSTVHEVNMDGTYNVLRAAAGSRVRRLLYCSSSEVHGTAVRVPLPEDGEFRPQTLYGASKLAGEYYSQVFHRSGWLETVIARPHNAYGPRGHYAHDRGELIPRFIVRALAGLPPVIFGDGTQTRDFKTYVYPTVVVRPFNTFGPRSHHEGDSGEVIPKFLLRCLAGRPMIVFGDGTQTRDFTYVGETALYIAALMAADSAGGCTFNICRGEEVTIREVAERVVRLAGLDCAPVFLPPRPHDVRRLLGDPSLLRRSLGSSPAIGIDEGLKRTVEWYRRHVRIDEAVLASMQPENWADTPAEPWLRQ